MTQHAKTTHLIINDPDWGFPIKVDWKLVKKCTLGFNSGEMFVMLKNGWTFRHVYTERNKN